MLCTGWRNAWRRLFLADARTWRLASDSSHARACLDHSNYSKGDGGHDAAGVMDALGIAADFTRCGHDRGGRVAHRLALDYAARKAPPGP